MATTAEATSYSIPSSVRDYIEESGYPFPYSAMREHIQEWDAMLRASGSFWDYETGDGSGQRRKVHRMTVHPARRVCKEYASLIIDGDMQVSTEDEQCTEWLADFIEREGFRSKGQRLIAKGFGLGTAGWVVWLDMKRGRLKARGYDARMVIPLSWDDGDVTECAFCSRVQYRGKALDQVQMHVVDDMGNYVIRTAAFDAESGKRVAVDGVEEEFETGGPLPWFALFSPNEANERVDFSPYGQSIFADAIDVLKSVDIAWDALMREVRNGSRIIFVSDVMLQVTINDDGSRTVKPFGEDESGVYRMLDSQEEYVKDFAPSLRVGDFAEAYSESLRNMGDALGFGTDYFVADKAAGMKTAREVASGQSVLMRSIQKHEEPVGHAVEQLCAALLYAARTFLDEALPEPGEIACRFDDSIIEDSATEQDRDLARVGIVDNAWEYRMKWRGEDEETARANVPAAATVYDYGAE